MKLNISPDTLWLCLCAVPMRAGTRSRFLQTFLANSSPSTLEPSQSHNYMYYSRLSPQRCQVSASGLTRPQEEVTKGIMLSPSPRMLTTHLSNNVSQSWVAQQEPAPRCDPIGLVLKLFWLQLIEILEPETPGSSEPPRATSGPSPLPVCAPDSGQALSISL